MKKYIVVLETDAEIISEVITEAHNLKEAKKNAQNMKRDFSDGKRCRTKVYLKKQIQLNLKDHENKIYNLRH